MHQLDAAEIYFHLRLPDDTRSVNLFKHGLRRKLPAGIKREIKEIAGFVFCQEKYKKSYAVSIILTSDRQIKKINDRFLSRNRTTDVICFPYSNKKQQVTGDIYISIDTALKQSIEYSHTFKNELLFLSIHGILHLLGWDDLKKGNREIMCTRQEQLLSLWKNVRHCGERSDEAIS